MSIQLKWDNKRLEWLVPVTINNVPLIFTLDSGSDFPSVTQATAKKINLPTPTTANHVTAAHYQIGNSSPIENFCEIRTDTIGQDLIDVSTISYRYNIYISDKEARLDPIPGNTNMPLRPDGKSPAFQRIMIPVKVNGYAPVNMLFDTGSNYSHMNTTDAQKYGVLSSKKMVSGSGTPTVYGKIKEDMYNVQFQFDKGAPIRATVEVGPLIKGFNSTPVLAMYSFTEAAAIYITKGGHQILWKDQSPLTQKTSHASEAKILSIVNNHRYLTFGLFGVLIFASMFIVFRKHHKKL